MKTRHMKYAILALMLVVAAYGQTSRGTVAGTVLDGSGAVVPGARVALIGVETGARRPTTSNEAGIYRFDAVDLGVYELNVSHAGFRTFRGTGIGVEANRVTTLDPQLEVGVTETEVQVSAEASEILVRDSPLRGGNFHPRDVQDLPLVALDPLSLARTLPGVTVPSGSVAWTNFPGAEVSINGQRSRGNNYLLDGTENNDIAFTGVAQPFNIAEAVEEVSVQTSNFGVEFGRAGGGVFNIVTKSGTNSLHGSLLWRYQSQRFNSVSNVDKLNAIPKSVFSNNVFGFTLGGPVRTDKTFFFGGFQQNNTHTTGNYPLGVPTADAVPSLRALFPSNPRLDLYLGLLGDLRGFGAPFTLALGVDPQTRVDRGPVQFGTATIAVRGVNDGPQWLGKIDHYQSEAHRLSLRYLYDSRLISPATFPGNAVSFPGFILDAAYQNQNLLFSDSYTFGPSFTNEFRFSYGRLDADDPDRISPQSVALAQTLPFFGIPNVSTPGIPSTLIQFRHVNNFLFQETQTKLKGRHAFRYGVEFLEQLAEQKPAAFTAGRYAYANAAGYSAFANFLDDYSGPGGFAEKVFGADVFHPNQFRQSYFFQDNWKVTPTLALTLGLRYEDFGQPANVMRYPAFPGFDPAMFLMPTPVNHDRNNFGPAVGLAWSPAVKQGWLGRLFGDRKTVWRGGYQMSYDTFFTQMVSLNLAASTPNATNAQALAPNTGRGLADFLAQLPTVARAPNVLDAPTAVIDKNLRSPYTERWSFGFQRQMPDNILVDVSYVGSGSHKLETIADWNPRGVDGKYLYPALGQRRIITSQGNSTYNALQTRMDRRFARGFRLTASYTWSRMLDSSSEGVGGTSNQSGARNMLSVPVSQGALRLDHGVSDFDRPQRLSIAYLWQIPGPRAGLWKHGLGGWSIAGITSFQSGTPFTIVNGFDRNNDTYAADRPDIGNVSAPIDSRAVVVPTSGPAGCGTGYRNPDSNLCVNRTDVHWIQGGLGDLPNSATVGRNTLRTGGTNNFGANLSKSFQLGEKRRLEFRWEALNAFNHQQFIGVPQRAVLGSMPGRFLNRDFTNSGIRSMWGQVKLVF